MTTKSLTLLTLGMMLLTSGCSLRGTKQTNPLTMDHAGQYEALTTSSGTSIGVESCDRYASLIKCIATSTTGAERDTYTTMFHNLQASRSGVSAPQLVTQCASLTQTASKQPELLAKTHCSL